MPVPWCVRPSPPITAHENLRPRIMRRACPPPRFRQGTASGSRPVVSTPRDLTLTSPPCASVRWMWGATQLRCQRGRGSGLARRWLPRRCRRAYLPGRWCCRRSRSRPPAPQWHVRPCRVVDLTRGPADLALRPPFVRRSSRPDSIASAPVASGPSTVAAVAARRRACRVAAARC